MSERTRILTDEFFDYYRAPHSFSQLVTMGDGSVRDTRWERGPDGQHRVTLYRTYTADEWAALHPAEPEYEP